MENYKIVSENIIHRRSTKPAVMNGELIKDEDIWDLLELADWAPTHAMTEPWRFIVYTGEAKTKLYEDEANLYKSITPEAEFATAKQDKILHQGDHLSHVIIAYMKRGHNAKITELEELSATAAAIQNLLLGASAKGISALWSTGGVVMTTAFHDFLELGEKDVVLGQLLLGYSSDEKTGTRITPLEDKVIWNA